MRVLLATDGSASADRARDLVAGLVWPKDTVVRLVAAVEPHLEAIASPFSMQAANVIDKLDAELVRHAEASLDAAERVLTEVGLRVERVSVQGRAADAILEVAHDWRPTLIVLGNRGHSPLSSLILGSTSAEVVDHAPCPVLVARDRTIDEIVLASDGSECATLAEHLLTDWLILRRLPVTVVSVSATGLPWNPGMGGGLYESVMASYAGDVDAARRQVANLADEVAARLERDGLAATGHMREGDAAAEIVAFARGRSRPLIVLGSRGHTGLARLVLGGVARNVLHHASGSVLIVRKGVSVEPEPVGDEAQLVGLG